MASRHGKNIKFYVIDYVMRGIDIVLMGDEDELLLEAYCFSLNIEKQNAKLGHEVYWGKALSTWEGPVCGNPCLDMFKRYGEICARNKFFIYKTFANLCDMIADDCDGKIGWVITRKGECFPYSGPVKNKWDLWINKGTLAPDLQEVYDKGHTLKDRTGEETYPHYNYGQYEYKSEY